MVNLKSLGASQDFSILFHFLSCLSHDVVDDDDDINDTNDDDDGINDSNINDDVRVDPISKSIQKR